MARNWDTLSSGYRGRLERKGISRNEYESGASLAGARGHAATPERPERAEKHPEQYQAYIFKRDELIDKIVVYKRQIYSSSKTWNWDKAVWHVKHTRDGKLRSIASLQRVAKLISHPSDLEEALTSDEMKDDSSALYYH